MFYPELLSHVFFDIITKNIHIIKKTIAFHSHIKTPPCFTKYLLAINKQLLVQCKYSEISLLLDLNQHSGIIKCNTFKKVNLFIQIKEKFISLWNPEPLTNIMNRYGNSDREKVCVCLTMLIKLTVPPLFLT